MVRDNDMRIHSLEMSVRGIKNSRRQSWATAWKLTTLFGTALLGLGGYLVSATIRSTERIEATSREVSQVSQRLERIENFLINNKGEKQ